MFSCEDAARQSVEKAYDEMLKQMANGQQLTLDMTASSVDLAESFLC